MSDLIARLRAAMDEEERIARATMLSESDDGDWMVTTDDDGEITGVLGQCIHIGMISGNGDLDDPAQAEHIAKQSPKRTLRRIARDRKILDLHLIEVYPPKLNLYTGRMEWPHGRWCCPVCSERRDGVQQLADGLACPTMLAIAEDYEVEVPS